MIRFIKTITLILILSAAAVADQHPISGIVKDAAGATIVGATIRCADDKRGPAVATSPSGEFVLDVSACPSMIVEISAAGFTTARTIVDSAGNATLVIVLRPSAVSATVDVTGVPTRIGLSSASVAVLSKGRLDASGSLALDDRLRQIPGFTLFRRSGSRTANPTTQGVSLRGVGASGASRALVLKDGIPLNDPFGGWVYWGRVPSESISEVEVLRGPASDVYGNSAVGGVVAIATLEPTGGLAGTVDTSYGNERTPFFSTFLSAGRSDWSGVLSAELFRTDGFIPAEPGSRGPVDSLANVRRSALSPQISRRFGSNGRAFVSADYYREVRMNGSPLQNNDTVIRNTAVGVDQTWKHAGSLALRAFAGIEKYNQSFSTISADRASEILNRLQTVPSQISGLSALWTAAGRHTIFTSGFDVRAIRGRSDETGYIGSTATTSTSAGGRELSSGAYVGVVVNSIEGFVFSGGVRFDQWRETLGFSASRSLLSSASSLSNFPDRRESSLSPRASILYRASRNISITGTVASSFRQPTLNELYRSFRVGNVSTLANEDLRPERATDVEASVIANAFSERLYARGGYFCTTINGTVTNFTLTVTPALITRQRRNLGRSRSCGFEADLDLRPLPGLSITAGYLFVDARVVSQPGNPGLEGLFLPQVPRNQMSLQATYSSARIGTGSLQMRASDRQFDDDQNLLPLGNFLTFDAFVSRPLNSAIAIYAAAENITGTRIEAGRTPVVTLAKERTFRIGLRLRFGKNSGASVSSTWSNTARATNY